MSDYTINLSELSNKVTSLSSLKSKIDSITENYSNNSIKTNETKDGIKNVANKITKNMTRLKRGYVNSYDWFNDYNTELAELEGNLEAFNLELLTAPIEFTGTFEDIFGKVTMPAIKTGGDPNCNKELGPGEGTLSDQQIKDLLKAASSQLGLPYYSMHYGPREGDGAGFGCAMFVSYCFNQVLFNGASAQSKGLGGFYGSTYEFWGNVTKDGYDAYNKGFEEVPASEAQAGDVICFLNTDYNPDYYADVRNCYHVALYEGDGKFAESGGAGVAEGNIDINRGDIRFLRYVGTT